MMTKEQQQHEREVLWSLLGDLPARERPIGVRTLSVEERDGYVLERLRLDLNGLDEVPAYFVRPRGTRKMKQSSAEPGKMKAEGDTAICDRPLNGETDHAWAKGKFPGTTPGAAHSTLRAPGDAVWHPNGLLPAVLFNHAHWGQYEVGKEELLSGRPGEAEPFVQKPAWGKALTEEGYCGLCIDHWCFGERSVKGAGGKLYPVVPTSEGHPELETIKRMQWDGRTLWGMMVYDSVRALDYLCARPEVDAGRVATLGMSMGSTMAWWLAALDERVKVCVDICCLTDFATYREIPGPMGHGLFYFVPGLLKHFSTAEINALIAPRPHLATAGNLDQLTPAAGLDRVDRELRAVYAEMGAAEAWRLIREDVPHMETAVMRREILAWLRRWL
ncbi:MAG: acetylxylan esterase [Phycisphaeraceae bacterium]|nr:acetylxylan esterase [Phycisphaeraceae bacterium]